MAIQGAMQVQIPASAVGANGYTFTINWPLAGVDLTTADTLSGNIRLTETGDPFPISGVLTATGANELTWKLHSSDTLTQGTAEVQFRATFGTDNIISAPSKWLIYNTLSGTLPPPDPSVVSFIRNNGDGTYSFLNAADFRTAIGAGTGDGDMPLIDPANPNNLAIQAADGSLVDGGTQIVLEQDPAQPTAIRNRLATGAAPNTLGVGAVDLQSDRNAATQVASGDYSRTEGANTTASGTASHAEGANTIASGDFSHAEGNATTASGTVSHAEGSGTQASGFASHAEGANTIASGDFSHAEGNATTASGTVSHAGGRRAQAIHAGTYARSDSQFANFPTIIQDEFALRARGGVRLVTATDGAGTPTKTTTLDTGGVWRLNDDTARGLQRTEIGLGTAAVADATAFDAAGSAATVQDNLDTHTGDATIHFTQAAISITPAQAGADPAGSAAGVQGNLDTHTGLTTAAHGGIVADTDARLTDARTPTAHASTHASAGSDPLTPADIGAEVEGTTATHAALEGTAVHGLGTAALLNSTDVGEDLVTAATVDGARETLDLPPQFNRPRHFDWQSGEWQSVDVVGSGGGSVAAGVFHSLFTGTTANSRIRRNINTTVMMLNRTNNAVNWSRRLDVSLQIRAPSPNAEGVFRIIICKPPAEVFGLPTVGDYVAMTVENATITTGHVCKAGVLTNIALTPINVNTNNAIHITSNNGTVSWYIGGTLLGTTTAGPTALGAGTINLEIENGVTAAQYAMRLVGESWGY